MTPPLSAPVVIKKIAPEVTKSENEAKDSIYGKDIFSPDTAIVEILEQVKSIVDEVKEEIVNKTIVDKQETAKNLNSKPTLAKSNNSINGSDRADKLKGGKGHDTIHSGKGNDILEGGEGNDTMYGGVGNDSLSGDSGDDSLYGEAHNDKLFGGLGNDNLDGGSGNDALEGGEGNDGMKGGDGDDKLKGGLGDDQMTGDNGKDTLEGGEGNDTISGGIGEDKIIGGAGNDLLDGGNGKDTLEGGTGDDTIFGGADKDVLNGGDGNDNLDGGISDDNLSGGAGNDTLTGGTGADKMSGGIGDDTYFVDNNRDLVLEVVDLGIDLVNSSVSFVLGNNIENLTLTGTGSVNGTGNILANILIGNDGINRLLGLAGNDTISGGGGDDYIDGGFGDDILSGGDGADSFVLNAPNQGVDRMLDFTSGIDKLLLSSVSFSGLNANSSLSFDQMILGAGVTGADTTSQLFIYNTTSGDLFFDADGSGAASSAIQIAKLTVNLGLGVGDFQITN
jgi:Ca2+-binding RTX toxin-like protein